MALSCFVQRVLETASVVEWLMSMTSNPVTSGIGFSPGEILW